MNRYDLINAIKYLKPDSEFTFENDDYSTINWIVLEGDAPTQAEIAAAINTLQQAEIAANEAKAAQRSALLSRLGITEEEARLLLS
jgi:hypothetical protein